jgi:hypothetical protein
VVVGGTHRDGKQRRRHRVCEGATLSQGAKQFVGARPQVMPAGLWRPSLLARAVVPGRVTGIAGRLFPVCWPVSATGAVRTTARTNAGFMAFRLVRGQASDPLPQTGGGAAAEPRPCHAHDHQVHGHADPEHDTPYLLPATDSVGNHRTTFPGRASLSSALHQHKISSPGRFIPSGCQAVEGRSARRLPGTARAVGGPHGDSRSSLSMAGAGAVPLVREEFRNGRVITYSSSYHPSGLADSWK